MLPKLNRKLRKASQFQRDAQLQSFETIDFREHSVFKRVKNAQTNTVIGLVGKSFRSVLFMHVYLSLSSILICFSISIYIYTLQILDTPLHQEWKVDLYGNIALTASFKVKGKMTNLTLKAPQSLSYANFGGTTNSRVFI